MEITKPKIFFGFEAGEERELARWDKIVEYFYLLAGQSDRIRVVNMGDTTEGNPFLQVIISAKENLEHLDEIKQNNLLIADPRGLSKKQMEALAETGKAICVQSMSLHSHETGGTQMSIKLAYELVSGDSAAIRNILDNVVLVMVPCFNPDGQIKVTDFFYSTLGTTYEGTEAIPFLYHKYAGHDNNRDAIACNLVESRYMNQILYHEWKPQCYQDFHHMYNHGARIFVGYPKNPVEPTISPLLSRELMLYGSHIAYTLERNDCPGAVTGALYTGNVKSGIHYSNAKSHNIVGFLAEAASLNLACPVYQNADNLVGEAGSITEGNMASMQMPHPWKGGKWGMPEIVKYMYYAAIGLMDAMAKNRYELLSCRMQKALERTACGENDEIKAYIIPPEQYDESARNRLIHMLLMQDLDVYRAKEDFIVDGRYCTRGSFIVPTAQPNYSVVKNLLGNDLSGSRVTALEDIRFNGAEATNNIAFSMGIEVREVTQILEGDFERISSLEPAAEEAAPAKGHLIDGRNNHAFAVANRLSGKGYPVYRVHNATHDFYTEADAAAINAELKNMPVSIAPADYRPADMDRIQPLKLAVYKTYWHGDVSEGWARLLFDRFGFVCDDIRDADILGGKLHEYDVFILPDKDYLGLYYGGQKPFQKMDDEVWDVNPAPYKFGLGMEGSKKIAEFVKGGGRLLALNQACEYTIKELHIPVRDVTGDFPATGRDASILKAEIDNQDPLGYGMPPRANVVHFGGPVLRVTDTNNTLRFSAPVRYEKEQLCRCAGAANPKLFADRAAVLRVKIGHGEVLLYGFQPHLRAQTDATFKLLFNALYRYDI